MTTKTDERDADERDVADNFNANCLVAIGLIETFEAGDIAKVVAYLNIHSRDQRRTLALDLVVIAGHLGAEKLAEIRELYEEARS
jgi:hypothetical protein